MNEVGAEANDNMLGDDDLDLMDCDKVDMDENDAPFRFNILLSVSPSLPLLLSPWPSPLPTFPTWTL